MKPQKPYLCAGWHMSDGRVQPCRSSFGKRTPDASDPSDLSNAHHQGTSMHSALSTLRSAMLLFVLSLAALPLAAGVSNVTHNAYHETITGAVAVAFSGDTLLVTTGTYVENVQITEKSLLLLGGYLLDFSSRVSDAAATCVDGAGMAGVMAVVSNCTVQLDCMMLTNGNVAGFGGGLAVNAGATVTAQNCVVRGNVAFFGGGCSVVTNGTLILKDTVVHGNVAFLGGGVYGQTRTGIAVLDGTGTVIRANWAIYGGGVCANAGSMVQQAGADVEGNTAVEGGGGICLVNGASGVVRGSGTMVGVATRPNQATNTFGQGGGVYVLGSSLVVEDKAEFQDNRAAYMGGGIYITNGSVVVRNGAAIGSPSNVGTNVAPIFGGGIFAMDSLVVVSNEVLMARCMSWIGGGVMLWNSSGVFAHATICSNTASSDAGALYVYLTSAVAMTDCVVADNHADNNNGGIVLSSVPCMVTLDHTVISGNSADSMMGGMSAIACADIRLTGGSALVRNTAPGGLGGAYIAGCAKVVLDTCLVESNMAPLFAGVGLFTCPDTDINDVDFIGNSITNASVGALMISSSRVKLRTTARPATVGGNRARYGAGIAVDTSSLLSIEAPTHPLSFVGNSCAEEGASIWCNNNSTVTVAGAVVFATNTAGCGAALFATNKCVIAFMPTNGLAPRFADNVATLEGGAIAIVWSSQVTAVNCAFRGNAATNRGGAISAGRSTVSLLGDFSAPVSGPPCVFMNNTAPLGGACYGQGSTLLVQDALMASNHATFGGGMCADVGSRATLDNCVIVRNSATMNGGGAAVGAAASLRARHCAIAENAFEGIYSAGGPLALTNCIAWANDGVEISLGNTVNFCDVDGGYVGAGNMDTAPMFRNPAALDYALTLGSPCVDTGSACGVTHDCIGAPRPMGCGYDMGAYELDPAPVISVTPTILDFGDVVVGDSTNLPLLVRNSGNSTLTGVVNNVPTPIFTVAPGAYVLAPTASTNAIVTFDPPVEYRWTQTIFLASNGGTTDVTLIGTGIPEPAVAVMLFVMGYSVLVVRKKNVGRV